MFTIKWTERNGNTNTQQEKTIERAAALALYLAARNNKKVQVFAPDGSLSYNFNN